MFKVIKNLKQRNTHKNRGASLTGYALIVGLISIIALLSITNLGQGVKALFNSTGGSMETAAGAAGANQAPTAINLSTNNATLLEGTDTSSGLIVATITISDDNQGTNNLTLSGTDATVFSLSGTNIIFSDATPNFDSPTDANSDNIYNVTLTIDDNSIGLTPDASTDLTLTIMNDETKLLASDGSDGDIFGKNVEISGSMALIGAPYNDFGSAYFFDCSAGSCTQSPTILVASDGEASDRFGWTVSLDGNLAIISAYQDDDNGFNSGAAYLFNCTGGSCIEVAKLLASDGAADDRYGWDTSLSGHWALVGSRYDDDNGGNSGSAYLYDCTLIGCTQTAKMIASDGAADDRFGYAVAMSGNRALVGALHDDDNGANSGSAYMFDCTGGICIQSPAKLIAADGVAGDLFAYDVAIDGDFALLGTRLDDDNGTDSGSAYLFDCTGGTCIQSNKLLASDGAAGDTFGFSVAINGTTALVGAYSHDTGTGDEGAAYMFDCTGGTCTQTAKLTADDAATGDFFGISLAINNDFSLIGARQVDDNGINSGAAYLYPR